MDVESVKPRRQAFELTRDLASGVEIWLLEADNSEGCLVWLRIKHTNGPSSLVAGTLTRWIGTLLGFFVVLHVKVLGQEGQSNGSLENCTV